VPDALRRLEAARDETAVRLDQLLATLSEQQQGANSLLAQHQAAWENRLNRVLVTAGAAVVIAVAAATLALLR
ncbi:MAG TPA: hypothetical protein VEX86_26700, partial [Longimicrobium sp.]|nr:hypothetical protein [Longimicrobium sp.]